MFLLMMKIGNRFSFDMKLLGMAPNQPFLPITEAWRVLLTTPTKLSVLPSKSTAISGLLMRGATFHYLSFYPIK